MHNISGKKKRDSRSLGKEERGKRKKKRKAPERRGSVRKTSPEFSREKDKEGV